MCLKLYRSVKSWKYWRWLEYAVRVIFFFFFYSSKKFLGCLRPKGNRGIAASYYYQSMWNITACCYKYQSDCTTTSEVCYLQSGHHCRGTIEICILPVAVHVACTDLLIECCTCTSQFPVIVKVWWLVCSSEENKINDIHTHTTQHNWADLLTTQHIMHTIPSGQ